MPMPMSNKPDWSLKDPVIIHTDVAEVIPNPRMVYRVKIIEPDKLEELRSKFIHPTEWISSNFLTDLEQK